MTATATKTKTAQKAETKTSSENVFENFWATGSGKAQEQFAKASDSLEDVAVFQRETADALVETATLAKQGFEAIAAETATFTQKSYEDGVAVAKETMATTSIQDVIELQTEFAKTSVDAWLGHMTKIGEMFQTSAKEVAAPMNTRVTEIVETAQKAAV